MTKPTPGSTGEQPDQVAASDLALWSFLEQLKTQLRTIREDRKALRFCLRFTCEHFQVTEGCFAVQHPDGLEAELMSVIPRTGQWDSGLLAAFLRRQNPAIPRNIIMAPVSRRGRLWAVLALNTQRAFDGQSARPLITIPRIIPTSIHPLTFHPPPHPL